MFDMHFLGRKRIPYKKIIYFEEKLVIETYVIGYKTEGESILFFIRTDGNVSYSGLVDCYCLADVDKVRDILKENAVNQLDFICWTHPDFDHSKGLEEIINDYATENTYIWIPEDVDIKEIACSQNVQELFKYLKGCVLSGDSVYNVHTVSDKKDLMFYNSICYQKDADYYPLVITAYTPNSRIIRKQNYMDQFIKNDRSIFFVLALGDVRIFFTGDIEDETLEELPRNYFAEHVHIMKIPHHGSDTSMKMLDLGWEECDIACATVYRKGKKNLPLMNVMKQYHERTQFLTCTGKADVNQEIEKYGIIKIQTDILGHTFSIGMEGNAEYWNI